MQYPPMLPSNLDSTPAKLCNPTQHNLTYMADHFSPLRQNRTQEMQPCGVSTMWHSPRSTPQENPKPDNPSPPPVCPCWRQPCNATVTPQPISSHVPKRKERKKIHKPPTHPEVWGKVPKKIIDPDQKKTRKKSFAWTNGVQNVDRWRKEKKKNRPSL